MSKQLKDETLHDLYDKFVKYSDRFEEHSKTDKRVAQANVTKAETKLFDYILDNHCKKPYTLETSHEMLNVYNRIKQGETIYY